MAQLVVHWTSALNSMSLRPTLNKLCLNKTECTNLGYNLTGLTHWLWLTAEILIQDSCISVCD